MLTKESPRSLDRDLKSILILANALKLINQKLLEEDYGSAIIIEYNVIEYCAYKILTYVPEVKTLRFIREPNRFGLFKEIETIIRAIRNDHVLFQECDVELMQCTRDWVIARNTLTHELMIDDRILQFETMAHSLASQGKECVKRLINILRLIRSRARNLNHLQYTHQYQLFTSIMLRFERETLL